MNRIDVIGQNGNDGLHYRPREASDRLPEVVSDEVIRKLRLASTQAEATDRENHAAMQLSPSVTVQVSVRYTTLNVLLDVYESTQAGFMDK